MNQEVTCKYCNRYLFTAKGTCIIENIVCPNSSCKAHMNIKMVNNSPYEDMAMQFTYKEVLPKSMREQEDGTR